MWFIFTKKKFNLSIKDNHGEIYERTISVVMYFKHMHTVYYYYYMCVSVCLCVRMYTGIKLAR